MLSFYINGYLHHLPLAPQGSTSPVDVTGSPISSDSTAVVFTDCGSYHISKNCGCKSGCI